MRKLGVPMLDTMKKLIDIFRRHSPDCETLDELRAAIDQRDRWPSAKALFERIRQKTLAAERSGDARLIAQYAFEEACTKTLYNLTQPAAPFDADSPYWIIPNAFAIASHYAIPQSDIIATFKA
jgi:hypothetical protein